jgi:hypothetical protein
VSLNPRVRTSVDGDRDRMRRESLGQISRGGLPSRCRSCSMDSPCRRAADWVVEELRESCYEGGYYAMQRYG